MPLADCPRCHGPLVAFDLRLDGRDLLLQSCSNCDVRFWEEAGHEVELPDVLGRDPARQPALR